MTEATNSVYFSFTTDDSSWPVIGEELRLLLATAFSCAGAEINTQMTPEERDWAFYGVYNGNPFTVVLVHMKDVPCNWFISLEGATSAETPDWETRNWAYSILEATIRNRRGTTNFRWHDTHETLRDLC